jgi:murein L,D-transpeptidase YafK
LCLAAVVSVWWFPSIIENLRLEWRGLERRAAVAMGWPLPGTPDLTKLQERIEEKGLALGAPVFMRIFKQEHELEVWMQKQGRFVHFDTYPICAYSGGLGPKEKQGDKQSPEGFYTVSRAQLNPNSKFHKSFNLGYPNVYDAAHGRTGDLLMVHGECVSIGCYAMTNPVIDELWTLINAAFDGGQTQFAVHAFPFRMTDWRMALHEGSSWAPFWSDLKRAHDLFERTGVPPLITVCDKRYTVRGGQARNGTAPSITRECPPQARRAAAA